MRGCRWCSSGRRGARGGVGRSQGVHVGHHWVFREALLSVGVHGGVLLDELAPGQ
jgi:hypothetical protein